jgi:NCS1 family nucleobase:cation symporter-1
MSADKGLDAGAVAALEGSWPVTPPERTWGSRALFGVSISAAVATWVFIIGGYVSYYLPAGRGTIAMIAGSLVGIGFVILAVMPVAMRHGVDSVASIRPQLGTRGSYLGLLLVYLSIVGWNCVLMIFLGRASAEILIELGMFGEGARDALVIGFGLIGVAVTWLLLRGGPDTIRNVAPVIATAVSLLSVWVLVLIFTEVGWSNVWNAEPSFPSNSELFNYTTGFEILVVSNLSWWAYVGGMARLVPTARKALWPVVFGLGLPVALMSLIGLYAGLAVPESGGDPTVFLIDLGGAAAGIPALAFVILANIGTTFVGVYVSALALKRVPAIQRRVPWDATTALALLPVTLIVVFLGNELFDNIGTFLAFLGVAFAPVCGIQIVDYYLLRNRDVGVRALYAEGPRAPYHFWGGFNVVGIVSVLVGAAAYIYLLDPVDYTSRSPYEYVSASIPAAAVAGLVYYTLTRLVVIPLRKGGYDSPSTPDLGAELPETPATADGGVGAGARTS